MINISPAALQRLGDAADEAQTALRNGWREAVECPHCTNGTVVHRGSMSWQTTRHRCAYCRGTGLIYAQSPLASQDTPSSDAASAGTAGSGPVSSAPARPVSPASPEQRRKIRDEWCVNCGVPGCDPAHLTSRAQGGCDDADCVIALCRSCHRDFDHGLLDLEPIIALPKYSAERAHMAGHMSYRACLRRLNGRAA